MDLGVPLKRGGGGDLEFKGDKLGLNLHAFIQNTWIRSTNLMVSFLTVPFLFENFDATFIVHIIFVCMLLYLLAFLSAHDASSMLFYFTFTTLMLSLSYPIENFDFFFCVFSLM